MNLTNITIAVPVHITSPSDVRLNYFKKMLEKLKAAARGYAIHFFIDAGDVATANEAIGTADLPNADVDVNHVQLGLGRNIIGARRACFKQGADAVLLIESDVLVSPQLVPLLRHVLNWSERLHSTPACACSSHVKLTANPLAVTTTPLTWCNNLMPRAAYETLRPGIEEYDALLTGTTYEQRNHTAIRQWLHDRYGTPLHTEPTYQDNVHWIIAQAHGIPVWGLGLNRVINIGEHGVNSTPAFHAANQLGTQNIANLPDDLLRFNFTTFTPTPPVMTGSGSM